MRPCGLCFQGFQRRSPDCSFHLCGEALVQNGGGFVTSELLPDPSQPAIFGQSDFQGIKGFACLDRHYLQFLIQILVTDRNVFLTRNAIEEDIGFDFGHGAVTLGGTEACEIELAHLLGLHSLCGQGAQAALETNVNLVLDEGLGNGEGEALGHRGEEMVLGFGLDAATLAGLEIIANALLEIGVALVVAEFFGEVVVQLGKNALLDGLDFDIVSDGFAGELVLGVVRWIDDFELQLLTGLGAAKGVGEGLDGVFAANFDEGVFAPNRFRFDGLGLFGGGVSGAAPVVASGGPAGSGPCR